MISSRTIIGQPSFPPVIPPPSWQPSLLVVIKIILFFWKKYVFLLLINMFYHFICMTTDSESCHGCYLYDNWPWRLPCGLFKKKSYIISHYWKWFPRKLNLIWSTLEPPPIISKTLFIKTQVHLTCDMWLVICDTLHVALDVGWTFSQKFSSLALTVSDLWRPEEKDHSRNEWWGCL
jgi:hypothetical protein